MSKRHCFGYFPFYLFIYFYFFGKFLLIAVSAATALILL